ncbi:EAL domain-containing protein [Kineococcus sp. NPDC059986]|jgi:diguanylate cyclase (GGDEF)-like protein|uniref:putative bifunctional diguanylate cyclase/phosphodiesterase n=1 Tax=Kineococcus sp. NPDC059986 TaxID=3155538 RepID=UPI00344D2EFF
MQRSTAALTAPRVAVRRPGPRSRPAVPLAVDLVAVLVAVGVLAVAVVAALQGPAPWRISRFAVVLAVVVLVAESRPVTRRTSGRGDPLPVSWGFLVALVALGPLSLALLVRAVPTLVRQVRRGSGPQAVVVAVATSLVGVLACSVVLDALLGASAADGPVLRDPTDWPSVLVAGAAGLLAQGLARTASRRVVVRSPRRLVRTGSTSGLLLTLAVLASAPVVVVSAEGGAWLLLLVCVPLSVMLVSAAVARRHERRALVDDLTGLPNRDAFLAATARSLRGGEGAEPGPGLLVVDLDHFKDVNDTLGHPVGDALLREVAGRLAAQAPADAVVARLGGDEFGLLVSDRLEAEGLALAVVEEMSRPMRVGELQVLLPASVGVALAPDHGTSAASLLKSADVALYQAKEVRGRACTYAGRRDVNSIERLRLLGDLGRAVDRGELFVLYQPQVDPRTGAVVGAEALVRWRHPELGPVGPDRFIPLAEQSGLVAGVTAVVLDQALADAARWHADGFRPTVSVNISARLLTDHELPALVADGLRRHSVAASDLVLEVTETGIVSDPERARAVVRRLRALGCSVAVDDYGTGQASLAYLIDLEVDELKIDRSFVTGMTRDRARAVIVRSTVQMGRELGLRVVAEGVADAPTLRALAALGCHTAQGEHVGGPMTAEALLDLLRARHPRAVLPTPAPHAD